MLPDRTDVLIVGGGPTGLALAASLQQAGVDHLLIDALEQDHNSSRAAVIHAHTLEVLEEIGIGDHLAAPGIPVGHFVVRDRDTRLLSIGFDRLPSAYRHLLMVPQSTTEAVLRTRLAALGGRLHRGAAAVDAAVTDGGASVRIRTAAGERTVRARFVVGADGMHSVVRNSAAISFEGAAYGESFVLADVRMDWPLRATEVSFFFSPAGLVVVAPLPDGAYRIVATVEQAPEQFGIGDVQALLDSRGPQKVRAQVRELIWGSRFRVHHRLAGTYRSGPFLLIGDAAHVHSPAGGQGMNTGLVDAIVLGRALSAVLRDGASETVLDEYARIRRPAAQQVLALSSRLTRIATVKPAALRLLRNLTLRLLNRLPAFKRKLTMNLSGLARRQLSVLPAVAIVMPAEANGCDPTAVAGPMPDDRRLAA